MPRDIPVGNGKLLIAFDQDYLNRLEELSVCPVCGHPTFSKHKRMKHREKN